MRRRDLVKYSALMLGVSASGSLAGAVLAGVETTSKLKTPVFNLNQRQLVAALAELIIPATDTPGAIEAGVPRFIEILAGEWYTDVERTIFYSGLESLDQFCAKNFGEVFAACDTAEQSAALSQAERDAAGYLGPTGGFMGGEPDEKAPFFTKIKELTVIGYYTSEVGAKQELHYNPMPMRYEGDYDFADAGRQWSS